MKIVKWNKDKCDINSLVLLWNNNCKTRHAFFPWTKDLLQQVVFNCKDFQAENLLLAYEDDKVVGFVHANTLLSEEDCELVGVIECLVAEKSKNYKYIIAELVRSVVANLLVKGCEYIITFGAWPYGLLYTTLMDGSERSGVLEQETELMTIFKKEGFYSVVDSLIMRAKVKAFDSKIDNAKTLVGKRTQSTWLDIVFRNRVLWDHNLYSSRNKLMSRAIFGRMAGESDYTGIETYSLFGVNTPENCRGLGYASENLARLFSLLVEKSVEQLELHVYTNNLPALKLYKKFGFEEIAKSSMLRLDR